VKFPPPFAAKSGPSRTAAAAIAIMTALCVVWAGSAYADPVQDELAKLNELTKQAQQLIETVQAAEQDLDRKLQLQSEAEKRHADDQAELEAMKAQLASYQGVVDKAAAAFYIGGRTDSVSAFMTARSPKSLIDELSFQGAVADQMSGQLRGFREAKRQAETIEAASAESAAAAKAAADAAAALRTDLQTMQSQLETQVRLVKATYYTLPAAQQSLLGPGGAVPTVGMSGLVPNARTLAAYIIATYPGVQTIGGVRADALPDHPSGHAIDIMIGSDMGLGDVINADVQSQAARFGVKYTMWRVANHFNHVHVTVS
jgi:peptidoglycan DL-endopeptidase CwlO